jgi:sterol desaturase/sphingolipid hydroxylase (fatty acid hydroxylase superfamily)
MENYTAVRMGAFLGIFLLVALWEVLRARRPLTTSKKTRWANNWAMIALNPLALRLVFPLLAVDMAITAQQRGWGALNNCDWPIWWEILIGIVALDFIIYLQHVMFHAVPALWRLHMVHHADLDIDLTTGLRFHPIEIIISMGIKLSAVVVVGPSPLAVLVFEVILNGAAMFNHGNISLPLRVDRFLRLILVTPDMHRVHHSIYPSETNRNFGFNLPWWDWLLGTYQAQPRDGHEGMTIGLHQFRDARALSLPRLLIMPFVGKVGSYPIGGRGKTE